MRNDNIKYDTVMDLMKAVEKEFGTDHKIPGFRAGDTVTVHYKIKEGNKERIQNFQGIVIQRRGEGLSETFTIRKMSGGIGVERIFPVHSPNIQSVDINKHGKVRKSKIFYLRGLTGKKAKAKIKERRI
jgi:large subunit ribosomal protein L19